MEKENKIGIFDSGIGGITVLKEILKILPNEDYLYYSDSIHNPYGDRTDQEIVRYCDEIIKLFIKENCKAIVIACNTASAKAANELRKKYPNLIIVAIEPAYKMVHDYAYEDTTLVMATKGTISSEKFNLLYQKYNNYKTYLLPCQGLADLIEKNQKDQIKVYLKKKIGIYKGKVKNVVLGCTHYPLIEKEISNVLGEVQFFNGASRLALHLKKLLEEQDIINEKNGKEKINFIDSSYSEEKKTRFYQILEGKEE